MIAEKTFNPDALLTLMNSDKQGSGAPFTVKSKETGKDFTFKISKNEWKGNSFLHVKVEVGYLDFRYLGFYKNGNIVRKGNVVESLSAKSISWILRNLERGNSESVNKHVEFYHLGKCLKCGRELTDATSIEIGLGPICRG